MTNPNTTPEASRGARWLATGLGAGYSPVAPGTAGSLEAVLLYALLTALCDATFLPFVYLAALAVFALLAFWSTTRALPHWGIADPQPIVIDEVLGQWVTYGGLAAAVALGWPGGAGWKSLLAGFILFRAFDVLKPFPLRRSERLPGALGVVLDDVLAGFYGGLGLLLLAWTRWLT